MTSFLFLRHCEQPDRWDLTDIANLGPLLTSDHIGWALLGQVPQEQLALEVRRHPPLEKLQIPNLVLKLLAILGGVYRLLE